MKRLLLADDEPAIRSVVERMLSRMGCEVDSQCDGLAAARRFERDPACWDGLITDYLMPGLDGVHLIGRVFAKRPDLPIVMMTGSINELHTLQRMVPDTVLILAKPFDKSDLVAALEKVGIRLPAVKE